VTARPLQGRRVLVTRAGEQAAALVEALRAQGAEVVEIPTVGFAPPADPRALADALHRIGTYDWLLLTSANAVRAVVEKKPAIAPRLRVASAGPATTAAIGSLLPGTVIAAEAGEGFGAEGLARSLSAFDVTGARMLFPVSDRSPAALAATLRARGAIVDVVVAYRTMVPEGAAAAIAREITRGLDAVTFASPSAIEAFADVDAAGRARMPAVAIGATTATAARAAGFRNVAEAASATSGDLAETVAKLLTPRP
jgi:uroporphyrinogen-III synthase